MLGRFRLAATCFFLQAFAVLPLGAQVDEGPEIPQSDLASIGESVQTNPSSQAPIPCVPGVTAPIPSQPIVAPPDLSPAKNAPAPTFLKKAGQGEVDGRPISSRLDSFPKKVGKYLGKSARPRTAIGTEQPGFLKNVAARVRAGTKSLDGRWGRVFDRSKGGQELGAVEEGDSLEPVRGDWADYWRRVDLMTGVKPSLNNRIEYLQDHEILPSLLEDVSAARRHIFSETYAFWLGAGPRESDTGWKFAAALVHKARVEGVRIRMMVSQFQAQEQDLFAAPRHLLEFARLKQFMRSSSRFELIETLAYRRPFFDHRKAMVADNIGYVMGANIGDKFWLQFHDQASRIRGPAVADLQRIIIAKWRASGGFVSPREEKEILPHEEKFPGGAAIRFVSNPMSGVKGAIDLTYLWAIQTAENSFRLANPLLANKKIVKALCEAALRGVRVQLFFPRDSVFGKGFDRLITRSFYARLLAAGAEIYEYHGRAHHKVAESDGVWSTQGSAQLDSLNKRNDELNIFVEDRFTAEQVNQKLFEKDMAPDRSTRVLVHRTTFLEWLVRVLFGRFA